MPREVSDIKQFIEISRRKDAKCTPLPPPRPEPQLDFDMQRAVGMMLTLDADSRTHKAQRQPDQVQGPMPPLSVHAGVEGYGKSG